MRIVVSLVAVIALAGSAVAHRHHRHHHHDETNVQLGPRPYYLVEDMDEGALKDRLLAVRERPILADRVLDRPPRRRPCSSRSTPAGRSKAARAWAPASSSAT